MCAKLSIQGSRPKEKKKVEMASSLAKARHGRSRMGQLWKSSTNRQARMPNWLPAGPTLKTGESWPGGGDKGFLLLLVGVVTNLCSVGQEDGGGQVACDAAQHVDEGDPEPASQLLDVPQHGHLEEHRHQAVQYAAGRDQILVNTRTTTR